MFDDQLLANGHGFGAGIPGEPGIIGVRSNGDERYRQPESASQQHCRQPPNLNRQDHPTGDRTNATGGELKSNSAIRYNFIGSVRPANAHVLFTLIVESRDPYGANALPRRALKGVFNSKTQVRSNATINLVQ
ncbi:MAG: hypothetical protein JWR75_1987 [Devosia sp.]|nr:hypothetical protein [Devosia sp.]